MFNKFWAFMNAQRMTEACFVILTAIIAAWAVTNNVDPDITAQPLRVVTMAYDLKVATVEAAKKNAAAMTNVFEAEKSEDLVAAKTLTDRVPNTTARVRLQTLLAIHQMWNKRRIAVFNAYRVWNVESDWDYCTGRDDKYECLQERRAERCEDIDACVTTLREANKGFVSRYDEENLIVMYRANIKEILRGYEDTIREMGRNLQYEECQVYPARCTTRQQKKEAEATREQQEAGDLKAARDFDASYTAANAVGKLGMLLRETAKRSVTDWMWGLVFTLGFGGFSYWMLHRSEDFWPVTRWVQSDALDRKVREQSEEIVRLGQQAERSSAFAMRNHEAVQARNRMLVLVVEAIRKSPDFHRSVAVQNVREKLLAMMRKDLGDDSALQKALNERKEEENMSTSPAKDN